MADEHEPLWKRKKCENKIDSFNQYHLKIGKLQVCEVIYI